MLTLYFTPGACSMAAHIVLEESGEAYEPRPVDLAKGEQRTEAYLKINPQGRVPALRLDDGEPLAENTAILPYLGKRFGLWPNDPVAEAKALSLIGFFAASVHPAHAHIGRPERYAADPSAFPSLKETGLKAFHGYVRQVDDMLAGREWFSEKYSVLDPYGFVFYTWGIRRELPVGLARDRVRWFVRSGALDFCGVAPGCREMDVQVGGASIGQPPLDRGFEIPAIDELPSDHHGVGIERAHRKRADAQLLRHLADAVVGLLALAHVNGKTHAVGRRDGVVLVVHEHELVARPGIREAHAARVAGAAPIGSPAHGVLRGELRIGQCKQMGEVLGRQAGNSEVHDLAPCLGAILRTPGTSDHPISEELVDAPVARMERRAVPRNPGTASRISRPLCGRSIRATEV